MQSKAFDQSIRKALNALPLFIDFLNFSVIKTAFLHISSFLYWSGTNSNDHGSYSTALSYISWVLYWSGTNSNILGSFPTAFSHIWSVSLLSGRYLNLKGLCKTAFYASPILIRNKFNNSDVSSTPL